MQSLFWKLNCLCDLLLPYPCCANPDPVDWFALDLHTSTSPFHVAQNPIQMVVLRRVWKHNGPGANKPLFVGAIWPPTPFSGLTWRGLGETPSFSVQVVNFTIVKGHINDQSDPLVMRGGFITPRAPESDLRSPVDPSIGPGNLSKNHKKSPKNLTGSYYTPKDASWRVEFNDV